MQVVIILGFILMTTGSTKSLNARQPTEPEDLAGRWVAPDGLGGEIGMNIMVTTTVPGSASDLVGVPQKLEDLEIGLYRRSGSGRTPTGFNFFTTSADGGANWDGQHLRIDQGRRVNLPAAHIDLAWNPSARVWTGSYEHAEFRNKAITLRRPAASKANLFVGTWFDGQGLMNNCLHIAHAQDGTYTGWADDILIPGHLRYANGLRPPERQREHYGQIAKVNLTAPNRVEVELRAYTAICCSHPFTAAISADGNALVGDWPAGPNQSPRPAQWTRMPGGSCIPSASHR